LGTLDVNFSSTAGGYPCGGVHIVHIAEADGALVLLDLAFAVIVFAPVFVVKDGFLGYSSVDGFEEIKHGNGLQSFCILAGVVGVVDGQQFGSRVSDEATEETQKDQNTSSDDKKESS